jgi:L-asparaginase II
LQQPAQRLGPLTRIAGLQRPAQRLGPLTRIAGLQRPAQRLGPLTRIAGLQRPAQRLGPLTRIAGLQRPAQRLGPLTRIAGWLRPASERSEGGGVSDLYLGGEPLAEVVRSGFVESRHSGSVVVLDATGEVAAWAGDVLGPIFPRSANKPMQAAGMLAAGLTATPAELAIISASHRGQPAHVAAVRGVLAGIPPAALGCPADYPLSDDARDALVRAGGERAPLYMNCSGKHAGMLRTCAANGWPLAGYLDPAHPVQVAIRAGVESLAGEPAAATGVDGCGAPLLAVSLRGLAAAFLRLVSAPEGTGPRLVADAMRAHPDLVSGTDAEGHDTQLMRAVPGLVSKIGAEGVLAAAVPGVGAVALKIDDGSPRARLPVLNAAFSRLGLSFPEYADVPVLGGGSRVGEVRAVW